ncbi:MAG: Cbp1 family collagen-binding glycoprotein adhesin [Bacteroidia bacterium]
MKKYFVTVFIIAATLFSCKQENERESAADNMYKQRFDSIKGLLTSRDSTVSELMDSFNDIERNLDSIARRQNIISFNVDKQRGELNQDIKSHISLQISAINELMEKNKSQIELLNQKLKRSSYRVYQFQNIITTLNDLITQKNTELAALNERLAALNAQVTQLQASVDTLSSSNYEQSELIASQTASIQTVYYLVGKSKDLTKMKVIDKKGGLLGIGKTDKLSPEFDTENFTRVDYTQVLSIPINSKKARVVTTHPGDSYILDKDQNNMYTMLRIIKPEKFWSASKYLVIINS